LLISGPRPPSGDQVGELTRIGEAPELVLAEDACAVDLDIEDPTAAANEVDHHARAESLAELGHRPGGLGQVVSLDAVRDRDEHLHADDTAGRRWRVARQLRDDADEWVIT
jgi:hypothetical protein